MGKRKYYTLVIRDEDGRWGPQFGDYSKVTVDQERKDSYKGQPFKIIGTDETQAAINAAVAELNKVRDVVAFLGAI